MKSWMMIVFLFSSLALAADPAVECERKLNAASMDEASGEVLASSMDPSTPPAVKEDAGKFSQAFQEYKERQALSAKQLCRRLFPKASPDIVN